MNRKLVIQILTHFLSLLVGLGIGFFAWNPAAPSFKKAPKEMAATSSTQAKDPTKNIVATADGIKPLTDTLTIKGDTSNLKIPVKPVSSPTPGKVNAKAICGGSDLDLQKHLSTFAASIEAKNIMYKSEDLSDCSGMFLRVMKSMEGICSDYIYPNSAEHRDTRVLGKWFYDNNNLQLTNDVTKYTHLIKPGAVIFYGHNDVKYTDLTVEKIAARNGIQHMGVVTEVKMENDEVVAYTLFHGRTTGKPAARTRYHVKEGKTKNGKFYPPYGNGRQQVVGIGFVTTPKTNI